jgi:predicted phage terminase large subunit-like protein
VPRRTALPTEFKLDHQTARISPALMGAWLDPEYDLAAHCTLMGTVVRDVIAQGGGFIMVMMPPRHSKTTTCAKWTPIWFLDHFPDKHVIFASYADSYAQAWGRRARNAAVEHADKLRFAVSVDSSSVKEWSTLQGGGMVSVGVGGQLTGRGADLLVIDDPIKDAVQASSDVWRERCWEWWQQTAFTRREPGATVILVMTRWHEDDLAGRLLASSEAAQWRVLRFPAIAEERDEIDREPGQALWPDRYSVEELELIRANAGSYAWEALYQQRPSPPEGSMFKRGSIVAYRDLGDRWLTGNGKVIPKNACWVGQVVDSALTEGDEADYTAVGTFACGPRGEILVLEVARAKLSVPEQWPFIVAARARWKDHPGYRWLGVEDSSAGKALIQIAARLGAPVRALQMGRGEWRTPDKVTRASQAAVVCENGLLMVPESNPPWLGPFMHELLYFPKGMHDDQVDTLSLFAMEARESAQLVPQDRRVRTSKDEEEEREAARKPFKGFEAADTFRNVGGKGYGD